MSAEENLDLDLPAAGLRADRAELETSVEVLANTLEQALPQLVRVERHKVGGFRSKRTEVRRLALALGDQQFELSPSAQGLQCSRHKVVRGITLNRQELSISEWLTELVAAVAQSAQVSERDRLALEGLLSEPAQASTMSPLFHRRSEEEKQADAAAKEQRRLAGERASERNAASLERIENGHIPLNAAERLQRFTAGDAAPGVFSSDLEVSEWSALARIGVTPITQVMGSSIYKVGWQPVYYNRPTEVSVLSDAFNECRRRALNRLLEEAHLCGADAVVAVRIDQGAHDWAPGALEFIAIGTAVRLPEALRNANRATVLSDLTGQEYVQLVQAGMRPVGIAAHTSVHYVPATAQTQMAQNTAGGIFGAGAGGWAGVNQELVDFTQGVYEAREKAMGFISAQVRELGGDGVIGVRVGESGRSHAVNAGMVQRTDLEITFNVIGTVVREDQALAIPAEQQTPLPILRLQ